jgi:thiosulfate dehydrogenase
VKKSVFIFLIGLFVPFIAGYLFLQLGGMPVATQGPPLPFEGSIARIALHAAMKNQTDLKPPVEADDANLIAGAKIYVTNCAVCHGLPEGRPTAIAKGLFPKPPQLFASDEGVTDDPPGKIYWKVKNGIRLTGMPGFVGELSNVELWQVSLLLLNADKLSEPVKQTLRAETH